ncbi:DNA-binding transcriptional LysR family regulator [Paraburkholderia sp. MM5482-R2]
MSIKDCEWSDVSDIVAALDHPLRAQSSLTLADTRDAQWCVPPRGTAPFEELQRLFQSQGLEAPQIAVETRSITVLKSLITRAGFLC